MSLYISLESLLISSAVLSDSDRVFLIAIAIPIMANAETAAIGPQGQIFANPPATLYIAPFMVSLFCFF